MTLFVNVRATGYGAVCSGFVIEGPTGPSTTDVRQVPMSLIPGLVRDKNVFLVTHGFNVNYAEGLRSLSRFETVLQPTSDEIYFGVLWPGDWIIPAINYPFEDSVAMKAGAMLADFCNRELPGARTISMASHSLGARVILRAIQLCERRIRYACVTAGAINDDCLNSEFAAAAANCDKLRTLSSQEDRVLSLAFPPGDFLADILLPDHRPFHRALGRRGPDPCPSNTTPSQIDDSDAYGHGDYLPPSGAVVASSASPPRWIRSGAFIAASLRGLPPSWPRG